MLKNQITSEQQMYFNLEYVERIIARQRDYKNNQEHIGTSRVFQAIALTHLKKLRSNNIIVANLGAGACCDELNELFSFLAKKGGKIAWVDHSPFMIENAHKYLPSQYIDTVNLYLQDWTGWLTGCEDDSLHFVYMEYTFNYLEDFKKFFLILTKKMANNGIFVANPNLYPKGLKGETTNAFYSINGQMIAENTVEYPVSGDVIGVHFKTAVNSKQIITSYKVTYRDAKDILRVTKKYFKKAKILASWQEEKEYLDEFNRLPENKSLNFAKDKIYLILEK